MNFEPSVRRLIEHVVAAGLAASLATACMGQDLAPPLGPPPAPGAGMTPPVYSPPPGPPPAPGAGMAPPVYSPPPGPFAGPGAGMASPVYPPPPPQQPFGPGVPVADPGFTPPPAALGSEMPPVAAGPGADSPGRGNPVGSPDDMMGFGGRGGMEGFGGGMLPADSFRYAAIWFPTVPVHGQSADFQMIGENLSFSHPLWTDTINTVSLSGGVRNDLIQTDAVLPDTGQPLPSDLWGVNMGLRYNRQLGDGWMTGGGVSVGSASDHPFATIREMNVGMNAMLRVPQGEHNAWLFTLVYSPMSELAFPIPGVAFSYNPSPQFHANIGLPLMIMWRPTDDWQFQASYMLIRSIHIKSQYRFAEQWSVFAAYDWSNETYILLDRPDLNDRFYSYDQRISLGVQTSPAPHWTASLSSGFVFDRYMFEGTTSSSTSSNRVDLGNGPFAAMNLGVRF